LAPKLNVTENDVDDEFAEVASIIVAGIVMSMSMKYLYSANSRKSNLRRWRVSD